MDLLDRQRLESGRSQPIVKRLRYLIQEVSSEPGWRNYWRGEGHTPDYSEIRAKLQELLAAGHADDVLSLGAELMKAGQRQVESSHDDGETGEEISSCMPVIAKALQKSSMPAVQKLVWATDAVLKDEYSLFEPLVEYLDGPHENAAWSELADILLKRLKSFQSTRASEFSRDYERDKLSDWAVHALERADRKPEIIAICSASDPCHLERIGRAPYPRDQTEGLPGSCGLFDLAGQVPGGKGPLGGMDALPGGAQNPACPQELAIGSSGHLGEQADRKDAIAGGR